MLKECIDIFEKQYRKKGEELITDNYILEPGDYFIVNEQQEYEHIKITKNTTSRECEKYSYLAKRDYLSRLLDMNKPIDSSKKIHSNNYYAFFIKNSTIVEKKEEVKNSIEKYYEVLNNPYLKYKDKEKKQTYSILEEKLGKPDGDIIEKNKNWIQNHLEELQEKSGITKEYIKVFFNESEEVYERESRRYIIPNIYNSTDYNVIINDETYGLPNDNMGLNSKKPYLENKTRKNKYRVPYLLNEEEVYIQKKFFDYLYNYANERYRNIYIDVKSGKIYYYTDKEIPKGDLTGYYLRIRKEKSECAIEVFDIVSDFKDELINKILIKNHLERNFEKFSVLSYGQSIKSISQLKEVINKLIFKEKIYQYIFENIKDLKILDAGVKNFINNNRNLFYDFFIKGNLNRFLERYEDIFFKLIEIKLISKDSIYEATEIFNLMLSINESYKKEEKNMNIKELKEKLRKYTSTDTYVFENSEEYYFAVGQLIQYLLSLKKDSKKTHDETIKILNCKDDSHLKKQIEHLFKRYGYGISRNYSKFNYIFAMIMDYSPEKQEIDRRRLLTGILTSSLFYEKNNNSEEN